MWAKAFWSPPETLRNVGITPFLRMVVSSQVNGITQ
nr:MAG TPA: Tryptophyllin-3 skin active peptide [Caudoviricetes sp.]